MSCLKQIYVITRNFEESTTIVMAYENKKMADDACKTMNSRKNDVYLYEVEETTFIENLGENE